MPFNPSFVYRAVKAFTTVTNHTPVRLTHVGGEPVEADDAVSRATEIWDGLPALILGADAMASRERTLLSMIEAAAADPATGPFDRAQVLDEIKQYLWAGTETTALVLAWALYLAATNRGVAARIREEADAVYGDRAPTLADYNRLAFTGNVIAETMRIYPPIWSLARKAVADDVIAGHAVKADDVVLLWTYAAHHDPRYWDAPERFDPDRFAGESARAPYTYLPFGGGKRACIGSAMSQIEAVLALSLLLQKFDLDYAGDGPPGINLSVTLSPKNALPMRIRQRAGAIPAVPLPACA
jgi:cytochrome P450